MRLDIPGTGARVLVRDPGPRVAEIVHTLLDGGAVVDVQESGTHPVVRDLAARRLVTVVAAPDLLAYDVVLRDPATEVQEPTRAGSGGRVVLVGGGPGDRGLLTIAGMQALREADVVVCDRLAPLGVLDELDPRPEIIHVGKIPSGAFTPQERINAILVEQAQAGRNVVRFKGGDSFVFGRGGEEWNACVDAGVSVTVIPGVTSSIAAPALAGVPLTHRDVIQGFMVVSGHVAPDDPRSTVDWRAVAETHMTLVVLMGVKTLASIADALIAHGLDPDTPAASVADAGLPSQRVARGPLRDIARIGDEADIRPPAVTVIGHSVAALRPQDTGTS